MMFLTRMPALGVSATRSRHTWRPNDRDYKVVVAGSPAHEEPPYSLATTQFPEPRQLPITA